MTRAGRAGPTSASSRGGRAGLRNEGGSGDPEGAKSAAGPGTRQAREPWHAIDVDGVIQRLGSARAGLSSQESERRLARHGPNRLPEPPRAGLARIYARQFASPLIYLLLAASLVSLAIGEHTDAAFIFAVLQLNALFGAFQEWKAEGSASALARLTRSTAAVWRDGRKRSIDSTMLVPGDLIELASGDRIPADVRLHENAVLGVDESLLTGESTPVEKRGDRCLSAGVAAADRVNMGLAGTIVLDGRATGTVTNTAGASEVGRIARSIGVDPGVPPLLLRMRALARHITWLVSAAIVLLAVILSLRGVAPEQVFIVAVALVVSAIPEGLPVAITVALSVAVSRMARRNVIVRALPAVEGLGACTVIATDKTGTLTRNELHVGAVVARGGQPWFLEGGGASPRPLPDEAESVARLARTGALCNEATRYVEGGAMRYLGDTVDIALLELADRLDLAEDALAERQAIVERIPYEPARRFGAVVSSGRGEGRCIAHVKGAGETVVPMCRAEAGHAGLLAAADRLAREGYRVIALASGAIEPPPAGRPVDPLLRDLELLGVVGLIDPLRPEVPGAIAECRRSGVDVKMITGDHPATALTIGRGLGLASEDAEVLAGIDLAHLLDGVDTEGGPVPPEVLRRVAGTRIFARIEPLQKFAIVRLLKRAGHFVAVTGDGVNDAPALDAAEIGVAMGRSGTDVARNAAGLLLVDDNFTSIVKGIEQGRIAYDNIRKVALLLLATGAGEIVLFALALGAGLPIPLLAVQLLWLNLVTNGIQDVALAFEGGEPGVMRRSPRPPSQPLIDRSMLVQIALAGGYMGVVGFGFYHWALASGYDEVQARTGLLLLMVFFENVHVFNCRSETRSMLRQPLSANPLVVLTVIATLALHLFATWTSGLRAILHVVAPDPVLVAVAVPLALGLALLFEGYKWLVRRRP